MSRETVEDLLRRRTGLDPTTTGPGLVNRAVRARMIALGMAGDDPDLYRTLVNRSEREFQALVEEIVIPESWFFRDEHPFEFLAERVRRGWLTDPARPPFRALSLPCASGEEPYSIAITLLDLGLPASRFTVVGADLSLAVLDSARRAVYTPNAFRSRDLGFRDRHFRRTPGGFELSPGVKATVVFEQGNVLDPGLFSARPAFDAVFCRNLLIYFDQPSRERARANLDRLLSPSGLLFLGHAEQGALLGPGFRPSPDKRSFAFERVPPGEPRNGSLPAPSASRAIVPRPGGAQTPAVVPKRVSTPPAVREPLRAVEPQPVPEGPTLEGASKLADRGRHAEAAALCEAEIRRAGPTAPAFFLLGSIRQAQGDREQAERCFEKAVYLDPNHDEAMLALSLLAGRRGDHVAAAGFRRRADRAYQEKHPR